MRYFVYILYSQSKDTFYKGQTNNIQDRLKRHNSGYVTSTSNGKPWVLMWFTEKTSRGDALLLEKKLKNLSRDRLIKFMEKYIKDCVHPLASAFDPGLGY